MANFFKRLFGNDEPAKIESVKEEGRFFFYNNLCSFKLPNEKLDFFKEYDEGLKIGLHTPSLGIISIDILSSEPLNAFMMGKPMYTPAGLPVWGTRHKMINMDFYVIKCTGFYVQVTCDMEKDIMEFINSFRLEK